MIEMTGIFASIMVAGKPRCARCGRPFVPRNADDKYGWKCARKVAAMETAGELFIAPDGVMIKNGGGNLCRGCGTDLSDEPGRQLCEECLDVPIQLDNCDPDNLFARLGKERQRLTSKKIDELGHTVIV